MRLHQIGLGLLVVACAPSPAVPPENQANQNAAILAAAPVNATWVFYGTMEYNAACYGHAGAPETQCHISVRCNIDTGNVTVVLPQQNGFAETPVTLITNRTSLALTAHPMAGEPGIGATLTAAEDIALFKRALMPQQERFAVQVAEQTTVFPWNDELYYLLLDCH